MKTPQKLVGGSVSFDHAADAYDATRALAPQIDARRTDAILAELQGVDADRLLEVGIGTGRIARPLMARGLRLTGVDIASRMMARLREQLTPAHATPDLLLADATALPFGTASFRAALVVHVLHLVSDWRRTLDEIRRVVASGGVLLHDRTRYADDNPWHQMFGKREELLAALGFTPRIRPTVEDIESKLEAIGASLQTVVYAQEDEREVAADVLNRSRNRVDSWTWEIPDEIFDTFFSQYEAYVHKTLGSPEFAHTTRVTYSLEVWAFDRA
ncbi:MAG: methyltransferase domain-containing protein [Dehalococcoidia bacterium]